MTKYGMVIDISKCIACYACFVACKDEFWMNDYPPYSLGVKKRGQTFIKLIKRERGKYPYVKVVYMPMLCMQCDNPPCVKAGGNEAVYKRNDGIVIIDPVKAAGRKELVNSCPYDLISWNDEKEIPQKCTFCVHRIQNGEIPRCVQACPSGSIIFGDLDDPKSEISKMVKTGSVQVASPEKGTKPNVYYIHLERMTKFFIAGNVAFKDTDECAENVKVTLKNKNGDEKVTFTDFFGTFEFDGLDRDTEYNVKFEYPNYVTKQLDITLREDTYIGYIHLEKSS